MSEAKEAKAATPAFDKLNVKQQKFVTLLAQHGNQRRAYIGAEYSKTGADQNASRLIRKEKVRAALHELLKAQGVSREAIVFRWLQMFTGADLADYDAFLKAGGLAKLRDTKGLDTTLVKSATVTVDKAGRVTSRKIELHDPIAAGRELGRVLGIVTEKHQVDVTGEGLRGLTESELLARARASKPEDGSG